MKKIEITTHHYGFALTQEHIDIADHLYAQADRDLVRRVCEGLEREIERIVFGDDFQSHPTFLVTGPDQYLYQVHPRHSYGVIRTDVA